MLQAMESQLVSNLRRLMDERGISGIALAKKIAMSPSVVNKILDGTSKNPRSDTVRAIAKALGVNSQDLTGEADDAPAGSAPGAGGFMQMHVRWQAEAGLWRETDINQTEPVSYSVPIPAGKRFVERFLARVSGDSMNKARIYDGDLVVCLDWVALDEPMQDGQIVLVQRKRDGGHMLETTVKQLRVFMDRYELHPKSSNPVHRPIVVMHGQSDSDDMEITIKGLVESVYRPIGTEID